MPVPRARRRARALSAGCALAALAGGAQAFLASIDATPRAVYLQVGADRFVGTYLDGGTPGDNPTIEKAQVTVPAAAVGTGPQAMSATSSVIYSRYAGAAYCDTTAGQVYVGGFYRAGLPGPSSATLSVSTPANLINAIGDTLPFSTISWASGGIGDASPTIPPGTFAGGTTQILLSTLHNHWFESCLSFTYANGQLVPAGTFKGRATYTLSVP